MLAHISSLLTGTIIAQLIVLATTPVISRLYTPEDIGSFAAFLAIPQLIAAIASLRYDMAVVLPESDMDARRLLRLALICAAIISLLASVLGLVFSHSLARLIGHPELSPYMGWIGIIVMCTATVNIFGYWLTRKTRYEHISKNRVQQTGLIEATRIGAPLAGVSGVIGQLVSQLIGQVLAALTIMWRGRDGLVSPRSRGQTTRALAYCYRRMPLLNAPNALVDALRVNGILLLIGIHFAADPQGQFSKAWVLMQAPVALVTSAVSQVFYQRFSRVQRGQMLPLVIRCVRSSFLVALLPFLLLFFLAPLLLPWYLGDGWEMSGTIAQALVPWLLLTTVTSPISTVFVVTDKQANMLVFAVFYAVTPLILIHALASQNMSLPLVMWAVSAAMTLLLMVLVLLTIKVARQWDSEATHPSQDAMQ
ncbi:lipopolysaccharide biosynthesis protein [Schaalia vaccimaxillae]|uniref:lipopolysaccharide biosynthesis protein n=1 Tax=Schaalia vaccimaxillae TaxID=183916 RepID=UPI0003B749A1|nr:oligosaccharide flippase family protein [Schaalia vaccimaxillae]